MPKQERVVEHYFSEHPKSKAHLGVIHVSLRGLFLRFLSASGVFSHLRVDLGTRLLVDCMVLPEKGCVLDLGCGYGVVGVVAALSNPRLGVILVDINERAVRLARENLELNGVINAEVRRGDLYEPVDDVLFDCVLSNPPLSAGMSVVKKMICEAPLHMRVGGKFEMVLRSKIAGKRLSKLFEDAFGNVDVLARKSGYRILVSEKR
jgi:16S rRNA (guanine1207-N2)-methyltransferase